jgi:hypothetical protein
MRQLGWVEGRNLRIEPRYVSNSAKLKSLAAELVAMNVDLIISDSTPATRAALEATKTIPIVFSIGGDPVDNGLVSTMSRPGGNATGYTFGLYEEKLVETLKSALPPLRRASRCDAQAGVGVADAQASALRAPRRRAKPSGNTTNIGPEARSASPEQRARAARLMRAALRLSGAHAPPASPTAPASS